MSVPAAEPLQIAIPALDNTFGAILIGSFIAAGLWGIGTAQVYWYFITYPTDQIALKLAVALIWVLDTVQQALIGHILYFYLIKNYFNPLKLDFFVWSLDVQSIFEILIALVVQSFYLMRIWRLSQGRGKRWFLCLLPGLLICAKFALGIAWVVDCFQTQSITVAFSRYIKVSEAINGVTFAADVVLAATMCWVLYLSRTGVKRTNNLLERLMIYTINTGAITSITALITLITAHVWEGTFIYGAFYFCTGRLYLNTMLASLNARAALQSTAGTVVEMSTSTYFGSGGNNSVEGNLKAARNRSNLAKVDDFEPFVVASDPKVSITRMA